VLHIVEDLRGKMDGMSIIFGIGHGLLAFLHSLMGIQLFGGDV